MEPPKKAFGRAHAKEQLATDDCEGLYAACAGGCTVATVLQAE